MNDKQTTQQLTEDLMRVMDFTLDELNLNRSGQLSSRQRERLHRIGGKQNILFDLSLGILVVGGGTGAPYLFVHWHPIVGAVLALLLVIFVPIVMVKRSRSMMDETELHRWEKPMIISNVVLGAVPMIGWMGFAYVYITSTSSPSTSVNSLLIIALGMLLLGPSIYLLQNILRKEVRFVEGPVKVEAEGFGPRSDQWSSELGFMVNLSLLTAVVLRNLLQGRGIGQHGEDFKFVTGYSVSVGRQKFHFLSSTGIGQTFVDGVRYRLYYGSAYPLPLLLSAEALPLDRPGDES
jgi:hypothetical protein